MIGVIICWYGNFPDYFEFFLRSCEINTKYDFLIFTDQHYKTNIKNVKIINMSFNELNLLFSKKLDFDVCISKPYKLCDFRPAYGIIFEDYLKKYQFWGHCDIDQIFGKIDDFVTQDILDKYEKINHNGHFSLYKNNKKMNELFKKEGSVFSYKEVFASEKNYAFDEYTGINMICKYNKINEIYLNDFCDINVRFNRYKCKNSYNKKYQIYSWENGHLYKYLICNNKIVKENKMYLHFQKKKPRIDLNLTDASKYFICSNGFIKFDVISVDLIKKYNKRPFFLYEEYEFINYYFKKIFAFIKLDTDSKLIWIKQKKN